MAATADTAVAMDIDKAPAVTGQKRTHVQLSKDELPQKILRQVSYYFCNANLFRDKFLQEKMAEDEGWVTIETLLTFNMLKQLTEDEAVVVEACRNDPKKFLVLSEDAKKIKRAEPMPADYNPANYTVFCKGLNKELGWKEITEWLRTEFPDVQVASVRLIRAVDALGKRKSSGNAYVELGSEDDVQMLLTREEVTSGADTVRFSKPLPPRKRDADGKPIPTKPASGPGKAGAAGGAAAATQGSTGSADGTMEVVRDRLVRVKGVPAGIIRQELREAVETQLLAGTPGERLIAHVDWQTGSADGVAVLRLRSEGVASAAAVAKAAEDKKLLWSGHELQVEAITGDEETKYWGDVNAYIASRSQRMAGPSRKKRKVERTKDLRKQFRGQQRQQKAGAADKAAPAAPAAAAAAPAATE